MNISDIVIVIGSESVPSCLRGHYGKIIDIYECKVTVEFVAKIGNYGNLSHTAYPSDLKNIGEVNY